ncbi:hypothetical protein GC163_02660 [bacterium]|nr:hypothetical protein [bacterium]
MVQASEVVRTLSSLRRYVHETLCEHENLVPEQFQLQEVPLTRLGERCGLQFVLRGPRNVRLGAVWASDRNQLFFYDARGERFRKEQLAEAVVEEAE